MNMRSSLDIANYYLGVMNRVAGNLDAARKHLSEATKINPSHNEAASELRGLASRAEPGKAVKKGGIFSRKK